MVCKYCSFKILPKDLTHRGYHQGCFDIKVNKMAIEYKQFKLANEKIAKSLQEKTKECDQLKIYNETLQKSIQKMTDDWTDSWSKNENRTNSNN